MKQIYDCGMLLPFTFKIRVIHFSFHVFKSFIIGHPSKLLECNEIAQLVGKENPDKVDDINTTSSIVFPYENVSNRLNFLKLKTGRYAR